LRGGWLTILKRNPFIQPLKQYFHLIKEGKSIWKHTSEDLINLARNVFAINGKNYIRGRLRDENGIIPFLFELDIATHFFRQGLDVEFLEYETSDTSGKTFEFLVSGDGIEREIECKWKSIYTGRRIASSGFYILCDEISKRVIPNIKGKRCLVELKGATKKFTVKRPALMACYIEEIESHQWKELTGVNSLSRMTIDLLSKENTNHIHTIGYFSEPDPIIIEHVKDFKVEMLFFPSPNCLYYKNEDIFFFKKAKLSLEQHNRSF
jgi:hypothetical protein